MKPSPRPIRRALSSPLNAGIERLAALSTSKTHPVGRLLRSIVTRIPPQMHARVLRGTLRGTRWITGASTHAAWLGTYEYEKRALFERDVACGDTVFDVGAHVGYYTLLASRLVGPTGRVFAFEPSPRNLSYLRHHLEMNAIANATVFPTAVSDSAGTISFEEGDEQSLGYTGRLSLIGTMTVQSVTLDALVASGQVLQPDIIKIDVEGAE